MNKTIFEGGSLPKTQSIDAVTAMLRALNRPVDPLPAVVELAGDRAVLIRSRKGDCYYTVTASGCSCPAATYRPGQVCKHRAEHFPAKQSGAAAYQARQRELRAQALAGEGGSGKLELAGDDLAEFRPVFRPEAVV